MILADTVAAAWTVSVGDSGTKYGYAGAESGAGLCLTAQLILMPKSAAEKPVDGSPPAGESLFPAASEARYAAA